MRRLLSREVLSILYVLKKNSQTYLPKLISKIHLHEDVTSIMVTHDLRTVFEVAERVIMIHDGKINFDGTPEQIKQSEDKVVQQFISGNSTLLEAEV